MACQSACIDRLAASRSRRLSLGTASSDQVQVRAAGRPWERAVFVVAQALVPEHQAARVERGLQPGPGLARCGEALALRLGRPELPP